MLPPRSWPRELTRKTELFEGTGMKTPSVGAYMVGATAPSYNCLHKFRPTSVLSPLDHLGIG